MTTFADLADLPEDKRIAAIGNAAMKGQKVAFVIEDEAGKLERYVTKLTLQFPLVRISGPFLGPVPNTLTLRVKRGK